MLRLLRAGRIAAPADPLALMGRADRAAALLARAVGAEVQLALVPRFRMRFVAWTEEGVETVEDVAEVRELADAFLLRRRSGRVPVRIERACVLRHRTEPERWHEVIEIERV